MKGSLFFLLLSLCCSLSLAQQELMEILENLDGFVMLGYFQPIQWGDYVSYGGAEGIFQGFSLSAGLDTKLADMRFGVKLANLSLDRQDLEFRLSHRNFISVLSFDNTPPPPGSDARKMNLLGLVNLQFEGLPDLSATFIRSTQAGEKGYAITNLELELSDRYKELSSLLDELRWQLGYTIENTSFATLGLAESSHSIDTRVKAKVRTAEDGIDLSPELKVEFELSNQTPEQSLKQAYELKTGIEASDFETVNVAIALTAESEKDFKHTQSLSLVSNRLEPVSLSASLARDAKGNEQSISWRLGVDYTLDETLAFAGAYSGSLATQISHSLSGSATYREQPWSAQGSIELGLQANTSGGFEPAFRFDLTANQQGQTDWSGRFKGSLQYQRERFSGSIDASADYEAELFRLSATSGLLYSDKFSTRLSLDGFVDVYHDISAYGNAALRSNLDTGDSTLTLGFGMRYSFGGKQ